MADEEINIEELYEDVRRRHKLSFGNLEDGGDCYILHSEKPLLDFYVPFVFGNGQYVRANLIIDVSDLKIPEDFKNSLDEFIKYNRKINSLGYDGKFIYDDINFEYEYQIEIEDESDFEEVVVHFGTLEMILKSSFHERTEVSVD